MGYLTFKGTYQRTAFNSDEKSILFLGGNNTLYYPQNGGASNGSARAKGRDSWDDADGWEAWGE